MENVASIKKPRFKILAPKPDSTGHDSCKLPRLGSGNGKVELSNLKKCESEMSKSRKPLDGHNGKKLQTIIGTKRGLEQSPVFCDQKRLKMGCSMFKKCSIALRKLLNHELSWPFKTPVDPVALKIPDYFSIISDPMDLGTIESKLKKDVYTEDEFDSDVRLTFSNAMRYNPPDNEYHQMAKTLNKLYDMHWRSLAAIQHKSEPRSTLKHKKQFKGVSVGGTKTACADVALSLSSVSMASDEVKVVRSKDTPHRMGIKAQEPQEKWIGDSKVSSLNRTSLDTRAPRPSTQPMIKKSSEALSAKSVPAATSSKKRKALEKSDRRCSEESVMSNAYHESDSSARCLADKPAYSHSEVTSTCYSAALSDCQSLTYGSLLSPSKEQRAEMLKKRFAETIFKAQRKTLLHTNANLDSLKLQQENERLEQRQSAERARIEAEMKASKVKQKTQLRNQRHREREAARIAVEKVERSVEFVDNTCILRELATLIGDYSFAGPLRGCGGMYVAASKFANGKLKSPLERLGLFLKDDYTSVDDINEGENFQNGDYEEGELIP